jgi:6-phosphogluconolactonase
MLQKLLIVSLIFMNAITHAQDLTFLVGTYTQKHPIPEERGIYRVKLTPSGLEKLGVSPSENPAFLAPHPSLNTIYSVNEVQKFQNLAGGGVSSFTYDTVTNALTPLNELAIKASGPCHLAVDATGRMLVTANYGDGSVSVFPIEADGKLRPKAAHFAHEGSGPNLKRQKSPHAHGVTFSPDNRFVLVPDLGTDEIRIYQVNSEAVTLLPCPAVRVHPGAGPRHVTFSPDAKHAYVINELDNTISWFDWDAGKGQLKIKGTVPTLPADFSGPSTTAEIVVHPSGNFVYGSNRGHNSLAIFRRDSNSGALTSLGHLKLAGPEPRSFAVSSDGNWLVVGNQRLDTVSAFRILEGGGKLEPFGQPVSVPSPVCILFVEGKL